MNLTQEPQLLPLIEGAGGGAPDVLAVLVVPLDLGGVGLLCIRRAIILMLLFLERKIITAHRPL